MHKTTNPRHRLSPLSLSLLSPSQLLQRPVSLFTTSLLIFPGAFVRLYGPASIHPPPFYILNISRPANISSALNSSRSRIKKRKKRRRRRGGKNRTNAIQRACAQGRAALLDREHPAPDFLFPSRCLINEFHESLFDLLSFYNRHVRVFVISVAATLHQIF